MLALPGEASSLRLQFPASYPAEPPSILGTYSSGESARRGAAARDLGLFREAVGLVYEPGQVCIFDAIEELARLRESLSAEDAADAAADPGRRRRDRSCTTVSHARLATPHHRRTRAAVDPLRSGD